VVGRTKKASWSCGLLAGFLGRAFFYLGVGAILNKKGGKSVRRKWEEEYRKAAVDGKGGS